MSALDGTSIEQTPRHEPRRVYQVIKDILQLRVGDVLFAPKRGRVAGLSGVGRADGDVLSYNAATGLPEYRTPAAGSSSATNYAPHFLMLGD